MEAFRIRFFSLLEIPDAVVWAERGNIAIHENYHSRRRQSYHVICGDKDNLLRFCHKLNIPLAYITASEFYRFWHLTWYPLQLPETGGSPHIDPHKNQQAPGPGM